MLELSSFYPSYYSELVMLAFQIFSEDELLYLQNMIYELEDFVLDAEDIMYKYYCEICNKKFACRRLLDFCPKCKSIMKMYHVGKNLFDIELLMGSTNDYTSYHEKKDGSQITKFDIEHRLNDIKRWVFGMIRMKAQGRRFKRVR